MPPAHPLPVTTLIGVAQQAVEERFGVRLEPEIRLLGEVWGPDRAGRGTGRRRLSARAGFRTSEHGPRQSGSRRSYRTAGR